MSIFNSFLFQLFGRRPFFTCRNCGAKGIMYLKKGTYKGQFVAIGKDENAWLIIECKDCHTIYRYDPIWGNIEEFDELKELAKKEGIDIN